MKYYEHQASTKCSLGLILAGVLITLATGIAVIRFATVLNMPTVEVGRDGECVRIMEIQGGEEVAKDCSDFTKLTRYDTRHVASPHEVRRIKNAERRLALIR